MSSIWDNFDHFEKFEIFAKYNDPVTGYVNYSRKNNTQMTIIVTARAVDTNGNVLAISSKDLQDIACLCHSDDSGDLYLDNPTGTIYQQTNISNYQTVLVESSDLQNGLDEKEVGDVEFETYIASNGTGFESFTFCAHLTVPGHGHFSTSESLTDSHYLPSSITVKGISSVWDAFVSLNVLTISHSQSTSETAMIYANGRNQTPVTVSVSAMADHDYFLNLMLDDFFNSDNTQYSPARLEIINYGNNDDVFNFDGSTGYCYTLTQNEWCKPVGYSANEKVSASPENGNLDIQFYVYSYAQMANIDLAVRIYVTDDKKFTTAKNSTGSWKKYVDSYIAVEMSKPVDYSDVTNLAIEGEDVWAHTFDGYQTVAHKTEWITHYYGQIYSKHVTIKPADSNFEFIDQYISVDNQAHLSTAPASGDYIPYLMYQYMAGQGSYVQSVLRNTQTSTPCTMVWGVEVPDEGDTWGLTDMNGNGDSTASFQTNGGSWAYHQHLENFMSGINDSVRVKNRVNLLALKYRIEGETDLVQKYWSNRINPASVHVIDDYGNSGNFTITWIESSDGCVLQSK